VLIQVEIRDELLQLTVLRFELLEATEFGGAEPSIRLPPVVWGDVVSPVASLIPILRQTSATFVPAWA